MKIGSLCTGYGGLDLAVEKVFDAETIWCAEFDKYASEVIEQRFGIANFGDIKTINWETVPSIDILTAGYPCQPFSTAGQRKGTNDPRHIWPYIKEAICTLRPGLVILENVRGHLTLGFKEVLKDLAEIGFDARWEIVRASDIGAPHQRARLFIIAYPNGDACEESRRTNRSILEQAIEIINRANWNVHRSSNSNVKHSNTNSIGFSLEQEQSRTEWNQGKPQSQPSGMVTQIGVSSATIPTNPSSSRLRQNKLDKFHQANNRTRSGVALDGEPLANLWWRDTAYEAAIERWKAIQGEPPSPLMGERLNPKFVEWMMGLPDGWVTDTGLSVTQQLKMLGNGVVPQQAEYAIIKLLSSDTPF